MRRSIIVLALLLALPAYAQQTKSLMINEITTQFPDQNAGTITPAKLRQVTTDMVNSWQQFSSVKPVTVTTYTFIVGDYGKLITFTNSSAVSVTLPAPSSGLQTFNVYASNTGTGSVLITPTGATINGAPSYALLTGQSVWIVSDGTNYQVFAGGAGGGGSGNVTLVGTGTGLTGGPITTSGTISCSAATVYVIGCVKPDNSTITISGGVITAVGGGGGGVSSVSVVSANGLGGSVATATTTPAITLSTSITGVLQGNGTAVSAAGSSAVFGGNTITFPPSPATLGFIVGSITAGHCTQFSGTVGGIADAGAACGSGGGGGGSIAYTQDYLAGVNFTAGSTTTLTLPFLPASAAALGITFDGINQSGDSIAWTVNLTTGVITFTNAIPLGVAVVEARYLSTSLSAGTVTSIGFADASATPIYGITGTPVIASGVISETLVTQTANLVFVGPVSGGAAQPTFRALVGADLPVPSVSTLGGVKSLTATSHEFLTSVTTAGLPVAAQPTYTDLASGAPTATASALGLMKPDTSTTGTLSIAAGVVSCTTATISQIGCVEPDNSTITISGGVISAVGSNLTVGSTIVGSCTSGYVVYSNAGLVACELLAGGGNVSNSGTPTINQLAIWTTATAIKGVTALPSANFPALTGDVTSAGATLATTVAKIGGNTVSLGGTLTTGGNATLSGAYTFTGTLTANTSVTFPTTGTLITSATANVISVVNSDGTLTVSPTTGSVIASLNPAHTNTWTAAQTFTNSDFILLGTSTGATTFTSANAGSANYVITVPASTGTILTNAAADQALTGGFLVTSVSLGTFSSGTKTVVCGTGPQQYATNGGAFTLAAPAADSNCLVQLTNNGSAGAISFSGFTVGSNTGDALDTTNGHIFTLSIWRINGTSGYRVAASQ